MLSALYYPFSRCIDVRALKQLLLVFDGVTFIDPVSDDDWRAQLMEDMIEEEDRRFANYANIHEAIDELRRDQAISVIQPSIISPNGQILASASALSDLEDPDWCRVGGDPDTYSMPHRHYAKNGTATWQVFKPKLPDRFLDGLRTKRKLRRHVVVEADENTAWTLSYEAGSAIAISLHLAAAEELALAPVTDSPMHHQLLLHKSMKNHWGQHQGDVPLAAKTIDTFANQAAFSLVRDLLPAPGLDQISLREVLSFRREMAPHRDRFVGDLRSRFEICKTELRPESLQLILSETRQAILKEVKAYQTEVARARDRIWPNLVSSLGKSLATGSVAAVAFNYIGGPGYILASSLVASGLAFLKGILDIRTELNKAERSVSPSVTYLSQVAKMG
jgi:hypothetical protein